MSQVPSCNHSVYDMKPRDGCTQGTRGSYQEKKQEIARIIKCRVDGLPVCLLEQTQVAQIGGWHNCSVCPKPVPPSGSASFPSSTVACRCHLLFAVGSNRAAQPDSHATKCSNLTHS